VNNLGNRTAVGVAWSFIDKAGGQLVGFLVTIVLARLLQPSDFGLVAMASVFFSIARLFIDSGLKDSLIQNPNNSQADYNVVFFFNLMVSVVLYVIIYFAAPLIATYYDSSQITDLVRVLSLVLPVGSFAIVQNAILTRAMRFDVFVKTRTPAMLISAVIGVYMAYSGFGVWALVCQTLSETAIFNLLLWLRAKWFPTFIFDTKVFRYHWEHGSRLLAVGLLGAVSRNILALVVGKVFGPAQLGFYSRAESFRTFVYNNTVNVIQGVSYPALVQVQADNERMKGLYRRILRLTLMMCCVIYPCGIILAEPLITFVLTDKWLPAANILVILSFAALLSPFNAINLNVLKAKRRTDLLLKLEVTKSVVFIALILISARIGFMFIVFSQLFMAVLALVINNYFANKLINYSLREQFADVRPVLFATAGASGVTWLVYQALSPAAAWIQLVVCSLTMAGAFSAIVYLLWKSLWVEVWGILMSILKKKKQAEIPETGETI
jgi:teichuronic acid exporter